MDITREEFASVYLNLKPEFKEEIESLPKYDKFYEDAPEKWDWREHGAVTPVKN